MFSDAFVVVKTKKEHIEYSDEHHRNTLVNLGLEHKIELIRAVSDARMQEMDEGEQMQQENVARISELEIENKMLEEKLSIQGGPVRYDEFKIPHHYQNDVGSVLVSDDDVDTAGAHYGRFFCIRHESETCLKRDMFPDAVLCMSVKTSDFYTTFVRVARNQTNAAILGLVLTMPSVRQAKLVRYAGFERTRYFWYLAKGMVEKHASFRINATNGVGKPFNQFL